MFKPLNETVKSVHQAPPFDATLLSTWREGVSQTLTFCKDDIPSSDLGRTQGGHSAILAVSGWCQVSLSGRHHCWASWEKNIERIVVVNGDEIERCHSHD